MATGLIIGAAAGALAGGASAAINAHEQRKAAKTQQRLQREANARQEQIAKERAGATPQRRTAQSAAAKREMLRSGLRQTILTNQSMSGTKLGD